MKTCRYPNKAVIACKDRLLDLSTPRIMGILNTTPDSFYAGSRVTMVDQALVIAEKMIGEGADILDVGGVSTRPNADDVEASTELQRVLPVIKAIHARFPESIISIDTYRAQVAEEAVQAGASLINDVSGGDFDAEMFPTVARLQVPYLLMHIQGTPKTMQQNPHYEDIITEMLDYFIAKTAQLESLGVKDVILDPGFGFGKTVAQNFEVLRNLHQFRCLDKPMLVGMSRKSMIYKTLGVTPEEALHGTTSAHAFALMQGANILRVHDVKAAKELFHIKKAIFSA